MPKPYTSAQKDALIDQLLADVAELQKRIERMDKRDRRTDREERREHRAARRQETDQAEMDQQQIVVRPAVERVRRRDGKIVRRVVRPR